MAKFQIKNRWTGGVIFETDAETIGGAVAAAIQAKADLGEADLRGANLCYANLREADLRDANLGGADLRGAGLRGANLRDANLRDAQGWEHLLPIRTIVPEGELIGWKKLSDGTICKLKIPAEAKRVGGLIGRKCRAEYAIVIEGSGVSSWDGVTKYAPGETVRPDSFDPDPRIECSHGIHFFITREEADAYLI